jgi:hypothetical protein
VAISKVIQGLVGISNLDLRGFFLCNGFVALLSRNRTAAHNAFHTASVTIPSLQSWVRSRGLVGSKKRSIFSRAYISTPRCTHFILNLTRLSTSDTIHSHISIYQNGIHSSYAISPSHTNNNSQAPAATGGKKQKKKWSKGKGTYELSAHFNSQRQYVHYCEHKNEIA